MKNKKCIICETDKNLIQRNAYYHGVEKGSGVDLDVTIGVMICVPCYDKLPRPRNEIIPALAEKRDDEIAG
jgi:hypothetical protein